MPSYSRIQYGFAFVSTKTGRPIKSEAKKARALRRFFESSGAVNDVEGVHVIARWRNPDDKAIRSRLWKTSDDPGQSLEDVFHTLQHRRGVMGAAEAKAEREYWRHRR